MTPYERGQIAARDEIAAMLEQKAADARRNADSHTLARWRKAAIAEAHTYTILADFIRMLHPTPEPTS